MKKHRPRTIELALEGDEDAQESVLESVVVPLFDLAFHRAREPKAAGDLVVAGLGALLSELRAGRLSLSDPLAVAARAVLAADPRPGPAADPLHERIDNLPPEMSEALVTGVVLEIDGPLLGSVLGIEPEEAETARREGLARLGLGETELRLALDGLAAVHPLPTGLVDRVLGSDRD